MAKIPGLEPVVQAQLQRGEFRLALDAVVDGGAIPVSTMYSVRIVAQVCVASSLDLHGGKSLRAFSTLRGGWGL